MLEVTLLAAMMWCRVEPVIPNGDDYIAMTRDTISSCKLALNECESKYEKCEVVGCGSEDEDPLKIGCRGIDYEKLGVL